MTAADDREKAIEDLTRTTVMSRAEATRAVDGLRGMPTSEPFVDEMKWAAAVSKPDTVEIASFMQDNHLTTIEMRELLREFRQEGGYSAFEYGQRDVLGAEFLNWFEWERLG